MNNYFVEDFVYSNNKKILDKIYIHYNKHFPMIEKIENTPNKHLDKKGVDRIIYLKNGEMYLIDEKIRRTKYNDILLEEYSNYEKKIIGWLSSNKITDYIAYYFVSTDEFYLFSFKKLLEIWNNNSSNWINIYGRRFAQNVGYRTSFVCVPIDIILEEIGIKKEKKQINLFKKIKIKRRIK